MIQTTVKQGRFSPVMPVHYFTLVAVFNLVLETFKFGPEPELLTIRGFGDLAGNRFYPEDIVGIRVPLTGPKRVLWRAAIRPDWLGIMREQIHRRRTVGTQGIFT
jgi:hypothetical protein